MKNAKSFFPSFWVKLLPIMLMLFGISLTRIQAQNYKPLNEAMASVQTALDDLKSQKGTATLNQSTPGSAKTNGQTPSQAAATNVKVFEGSYYERFLELAKLNADVATAVQELDTQFNSAGQPQTRVTTITNARNELMHLITY